MTGNFPLVPKTERVVPIFKEYSKLDHNCCKKT